jgi:tellurite resistance protein TehA-like permease
MGPLGLSGFSIIVLGKVARHNFPLTGTFSESPIAAGGIFYLVGCMLGLILWGFAVLWFVIAIIMIATAPSFPFNMGWWGFIFPIGKLDIILSKMDYSRCANCGNRHLYALNNRYR